jgi:hypothetical protein
LASLKTVEGERCASPLDCVQERIRRAERKRSVAKVRAVEERKRRRLHLGLTDFVFAMTSVGRVVATFAIQDRFAVSLTERVALRSQIERSAV